MTLVRAIATQAARVPKAHQKLDAETLTVKEGKSQSKKGIGTGLLEGTQTGR